ncbi:MAG: iron ABC transporter permease [Clostridia bacterium]|nr:iron ABC transporter permease [Clostridia bacterium]
MKTNVSPKKHILLYTVILSAVLVCLFLCAVRFGSAPMSAKAFWSAMLGKEGFETERLILFSVRLPRAIAGLLAGIGLSVSGVLLQSVTDNALAGPNIIGVNAGAGFASALMLSFLPAASPFLPAASFAGAFLTTLLIVLTAGRSRSKTGVILAGIALTTLFNACISLLTLLNDDILISYNAFSIGGFAGVPTDRLLLPAIFILVSFSIALLFGRQMDALCLGEAGASVLGIPVRQVRLVCIFCASASAGAVVSFAGLLGFVGLVVPHITRKLTGCRGRALLFFSALFGGCVTIAADLAGRLILAPTEIPVGIMMAFIGAPFFLWLLFRRRNSV